MTTVTPGLGCAILIMAMALLVTPTGFLTARSPIPRSWKGYQENCTLHTLGGSSGDPLPLPNGRANSRHPPVSTHDLLAVVIPAYRVADQILAVIAGIGTEVQLIHVVDDVAPEPGTIVQEHCSDPRVQVLLHPRNTGVGGAVLTGMRAALADGADLIVKLDGDGQMDPSLIEALWHQSKPDERIT